MQPLWVGGAVTRCSGCGAMLPPSRDTDREIPLFCAHCTVLRSRDRARAARTRRQMSAQPHPE